MVSIFAIFYPACYNKKAGTKLAVKEQFRLPDIPFAITDPILRSNYLTSHYWDHFDFNDTSIISKSDITEQAFVDFISLLPYAEKDEADKAIEHVLTKASIHKTGIMYDFFIQLFEKYLYDPNSPIRNDEFYIPVLKCEIGSHYSDEPSRLRAEYTLGMLMKNRIGFQAANIHYTLESGKKGDLYGLRTEFVLLIFYNPDCHACSEVLFDLRSLSTINQALQAGRLSILAFYPDKDVNIWRKYLVNIPDNWINGYDSELAVENQNIYDLKAIPTLYLLDAGKRVILKDTHPVIVEQWLEEKGF